MYTVKQGGRVDYYYKEIYCDTMDDFNKLDLDSAEFKNICAGSVAYIIATGDVYILNSQKQWIKQ